jgi:hypothetical protein
MQDYEKFYQLNAKRLREEHHLEMAEVNVRIGENAREMTTAAYKQAMALIDGGYASRALVINTAGNQRWALKIAREAAPGGRIGDSVNSQIRVYGSPAGRLSKEYYTLKDIIERSGVDLVLVNVWELTSCNPRYKEELLFQLRELTSLNLTVIVYSVSKVPSFTPGVLMRGSLGRLSVIAATIWFAIDDEDELEEEETTIERSEKLVGSKGLIQSHNDKSKPEDLHNKHIDSSAQKEHRALEYA